MIFDESVKNLISCAYDAHNDVMLSLSSFSLRDFVSDRVRTAVFLPGAFCTKKDYTFSDAGTGYMFIPPGYSPPLIYADIRFMADGDFRDWLTKSLYGRIIIPFAELADPSEYGYRQAYSWVGEYKSEIKHFCQTLCLFSVKPRDTDYFAGLYNCKKGIFAGEDNNKDIIAVKAKSRNEKFFMLASDIEKYAHKKSVIYFTTRNECSAFGNFLYRRGTGFSCYDGSLSARDRKYEIENFTEGKNDVMLATKSFIPSSFSVRADRVFYCGAPYSEAHLMRCSAFINENPAVYYTDEDFNINRRISEGFADISGEPDIVENRQKSLIHIKEILDKGEL